MKQQGSRAHHSGVYKQIPAKSDRRSGSFMAVDLSPGTAPTPSRWATLRHRAMREGGNTHSGPLTCPSPPPLPPPFRPPHPPGRLAAGRGPPPTPTGGRAAPPPRPAAAPARPPSCRQRHPLPPPPAGEEPPSPPGYREHGEGPGGVPPSAAVPPVGRAGIKKKINKWRVKRCAELGELRP